MASITELLQQARGGDQRATDQLLASLYSELRSLAARRLRNERPGQTLEATALVHEAYLRLLGDEQTRWENRGHFFQAASEAMRRILIEAARRKARLKHGGGRARQELDEMDCITLPAAVDLLALDEAMEQLQREDPVKAELVQLRFFGGLSVEEAGEVLGISRATADRYWAFARAWLFRRVEGKSPGTEKLPPT